MEEMTSPCPAAGSGERARQLWQRNGWRSSSSSLGSDDGGDGGGSRGAGGGESGGRRTNKRRTRIWTV
uniref:Uncharacterized protein n=1 Tax=Arundo donax TaxID=35708 RepID=A0A0A8YT42_ARUDO